MMLLISTIVYSMQISKAIRLALSNDLIKMADSRDNKPHPQQGVSRKQRNHIPTTAKPSIAAYLAYTSAITAACVLAIH